MWSIGSSVQRLSSLSFHALEPRPNAAPSLRPMMGEQLNKYNVGAVSYRLENNGRAQSLTFVSDVALLVISIGEAAGNDFADSKKAWPPLSMPPGLCSLLSSRQKCLVDIFGGGFKSFQVC